VAIVQIPNLTSFREKLSERHRNVSRFWKMKRKKSIGSGSVKEKKGNELRWLKI